MQKIFKILPLVMLLGSCSVSEVINPDEYDAAKHSRLRIFSHGSNAAAFFIGVDCETNKKGTRVLADGVDVFIGAQDKQKRIGMTQTDATDYAQSKGGIFKEYVIPAGKVVNIIPSHQISQTVCRVAGKPCTVETKELCQYGVGDNVVSKGINSIRKLFIRTITLGATDGGKPRDDSRSFIPEAGKQYEYVPNGCSVVITDITEEKVTIVNTSPFYQCPKE